MGDFMIYTNNIKDLRTKRGLSLRQLAKYTGISKSSLSAIERDEQDFKVSTLVILTKFFNSDLSDVIKF